MRHSYNTREIIVERLEDWLKAYFLTDNNDRNKILNKIITNWWYERATLDKPEFPTFVNWFEFKRVWLYYKKDLL